MSQVIMNQERPDIWQALKDLHFVTDFFSWLFALFSRLAEPLMLLCTLYIVAEAGVPSIALPALHNISIGLMITAPEIILPGSFVVASKAQEHARLLFIVCWTFVLLTLITLVSLFVWHFTGASLAWLMCARCAAAVGYSILMRVMSHGQQTSQGPRNESSTITPIANSQQAITIRATKAHKRIAANVILFQHYLKQMERETPLRLPETVRETGETANETGETEASEPALDEQIKALLEVKADLPTREVAAIVGRPHTTVFRALNRVKQMKQQ